MEDDLMTEESILAEHAIADSIEADPIGSDAVGGMTEPLSMDGGGMPHTADAGDTPVEPEVISRSPIDGGGDTGDASQPPDGAPTNIHGSMASLRDDPHSRGSVHGSMASLRGNPAAMGSAASLRGDPVMAEGDHSIRGSVASLRGDPPIPASVRGSTTSVREAGDRPAVPVNRPPTSRPPLSAAAARPADSTIRGNKMALKNKKNSMDLQENALIEDAEEEFQGENIWVIAEKMNQARILRGLELTESHSTETTLLFVGGKQAGKSSLIHKFLDRDEEPKKTLGLEYSYGRKAGKSVLKDVCHIWELGGGTTYTPLLETPLKAERLPSLSILLVVDLTKPQTMWSTLETMLKTLREGVESEIASAIGRQMQLQERLKSATELRVPSDHPDAAHLKPFPVPLVLVGGHYDTFQDWDPEKKKLICRSLRYLAHVNGASLYFFSPRDSALVKKVKDLINQLAFGGPSSGYLAQDYNKPLLVPAGTDSLAGILGVGADTSFSTARNTFAAQYPQDAQSAAALPDDPAKDMSYREAEIDQLRSQKDQELERLRRELERRRRWGDEF